MLVYQGLIRLKAVSVQIGMDAAGIIDFNSNGQGDGETGGQGEGGLRIVDCGLRIAE